MWRGGCRSHISVSASLVWRCLSGATVAPFPHPAHRTGHADLPHPALGQDLTPLLSRATPSALSNTKRPKLRWKRMSAVGGTATAREFQCAGRCFVLHRHKCLLDIGDRFREAVARRKQNFGAHAGIPFRGHSPWRASSSLKSTGAPLSSTFTVAVRVTGHYAYRHSSWASRLTAGAAGFFTLTQSRDRPEL